MLPISSTYRYDLSTRGILGGLFVGIAATIINLAFDLIGKGVLDNALDFGKFLYQNAKN